MLEAPRSTSGLTLRVTAHMAEPLDIFRVVLLPDNLVAAVKPILDAMRHIGFLKNDNDTWLQLSVKQCQDGTLRQTVIEIERA